MRVWIDTEFNGFNGDLISMALVDEHRRQLYFVLTMPQEIDPWVAEHVIPILGKAPIGRVLAQLYLQAFLDNYDSVHLIADWPEDIAHFCRFLITKPGERISTPSLTMEIRRDLDAVSETPHNALCDVLAMRLKHLEIESAAWQTSHPTH